MAAAPITPEQHNRPKDPEMEIPLVMECSEEPIIISKIETVGAKDDFDGNGNKGLKIRLHLQTESEVLLPAEIEEPILKLAEVSRQGAEGNKNSISISVGRDFRADYYTVKDERNRHNSFTVDKVLTPRIVVSSDGLILKWKVDAIVSVGVAGQLCESVKDETLLTIEAIQPELFTGGGYSDPETDLGK